MVIEDRRVDRDRMVHLVTIDLSDELDLFSRSDPLLKQLCPLRSLHVLVCGVHEFAQRGRRRPVLLDHEASLLLDRQAGLQVRTLGRSGQ
jgi:hypothetical protein